MMKEVIETGDFDFYPVEHHITDSSTDGKKVEIKSDLQTERLEDIIQWSETKFENL